MTPPREKVYLHTVAALQTLWRSVGEPIEGYSRRGHWSGGEALCRTARVIGWSGKRVYNENRRAAQDVLTVSWVLRQLRIALAPRRRSSALCACRAAVRLLQSAISASVAFYCLITAV